MQVTLRTALLDALRDHALFPEIEIFDKTIGPLDLYQGSRLLAKLTELCHAHIRRERRTLLPEAMTIPTDIQANGQISKVEMHEQISRLDKYIMALRLGGDAAVEADLLEHFYEVLRDHPRPIVTTIVRVAEEKGNTISALRTVVLDYMPLDTTRSDSSTANSASAPPPEPSLMERTCTAMMSFLSSTGSRSNPPEAGGSGRGKSYTPVQQHSFIERLKAQSKAKDKTIKTLQQTLRGTSAGQGDSVRGGRGGRGNGGGGRSRGRGRVRFADDGQPEADFAQGPANVEIFCATMDTAIHSDLAFEQDADQAVADQAKRDARTDRPDAFASPSDEESSDDDSPPTAPLDLPVEEPPVYSTRNPWAPASSPK